MLVLSASILSMDSAGCLLVPDLILSIRPSLQSRFLLREHPLEILVPPTGNSYGSFVLVGSPISPVLSWASGKVSLPPPPPQPTSKGIKGRKEREGTFSSSIPSAFILVEATTQSDVVGPC